MMPLLSVQRTTSGSSAAGRTRPPASRTHMSSGPAIERRIFIVQWLIVGGGGEELWVVGSRYGTDQQTSGSG
jgi:hypothetical protein